ncbi:hypothetical protein EJB05_51967 [Eragrostis curvula]|uniref:Uncharacterized protein n=1 Tax=Eragrostis curvula TaxID=38414 RepID=A0A5J9SUH1_9POAL|nr:hypothetical protein EJB05_51967 [Eragrostis curvula]
MATRMARRCGGEPAVRKGPWTLEEDLVLVSYISEHGEGSWDNLARAAGYGQGAVAVATGVVKSEGASSASQDDFPAGDCWYVPLKTEQPAYCQGAMAVATGVVKSERASSASASKKDGSSAPGAWCTQAIYPYHSELSSAHLGMAGVDASTTQFFSSEFTDSFWNAVNNFWETVPATGAF